MGAFLHSGCFLATVYIDKSVYQAVAEKWEETYKKVKLGTPDTGREQGNQKGSGKGIGKGKNKGIDTIIGDSPFEYKLAKVTDWHYDENVRAHQEDKEDL